MAVSSHWFQHYEWEMGGATNIVTIEYIWLKLICHFSDQTFRASWFFLNTSIPLFVPILPYTIVSSANFNILYSLQYRCHLIIISRKEAVPKSTLDRGTPLDPHIFPFRRLSIYYLPHADAVSFLLTILLSNLKSFTFNLFTFYLFFNLLPLLRLLLVSLLKLLMCTISDAL